MERELLMAEEKLVTEQQLKEEEEEEEVLYNRVEELKRSIASLLEENDVLGRFISRLDPQELVSQAVGEAAGASQLEGGGQAWRRRSHPHMSDQLQQLTLEQKLYVAQWEVTETRQDQERLKQRYERIQDSFKASLKEAELRLAEIRRAKKEFERRLVKPMKDNRLDMNEPEKVIQYIEDKLKLKQVTELEKLNLKIQALKVQENKLQQQLQQKKETGKSEYKEIFQEHSEQRFDKSLKELQVSSLKVQRVLSSYKEKLHSVTQESTELSSDINNKKQMLARIEEEIQQAAVECLKAEELNRRLQQQRTDYQAPDISEYIQVKDKHKKLRQSIHTWERKVAIAEMNLRTHTRGRSKQRATRTPANSAAAGARSGEEHVSVKLPHITEHNA